MELIVFLIAGTILFTMIANRMVLVGEALDQFSMMLPLLAPLFLLWVMVFH